MVEQMLCLSNHQDGQNITNCSWNYKYVSGIGYGKKRIAATKCIKSFKSFIEKLVWLNFVIFDIINYLTIGHVWNGL